MPGPAATFSTPKAALLVTAVALAASVVGIVNGYAMDDFHLIAEDPRVHSFPDPARVFASPYWPEPFNRDLYRPFATLSFAFQWALGGGSPVVFRVVSYALYALTSIAVLTLARRLLPDAVALGVALLFAAHPVHVEAVALGVNQGEQLVGLLSVLVAVRYLDLRRRGWPAPLDWVTLCLVYLLACLFKENAVVMPGLLLAIELALLRGTPARERALRLWPGFLAMTALGAGFLAVRASVLGSFAGSFTAEAMVGQGAWGRTLTMLQVVPHWLRLLVWPAHLQGDYSPAEISQASGWGLPQMSGTILLLAAVVTAWVCRRGAPVVSFGLVWCAVALLPVSNVLLPTGVVLTERSLFLPSVGFLLALGGVAAVALKSRPAVGRGLALAAAAMVILGVARSAVRQRDWKDHFTFWEATARDAPRSHKAHYAYGQQLRYRGDDAAAVSSLRTAMALHPSAYWVHNELADLHKNRGECEAAVELFAESLDIRPDQPAVRISRMACLLQLGRIDEARAAADEAIRVQENPGARP